MENRKEKRFGERDRVFILDNGQALKTAANCPIHAYTQDISISGVQICSNLDPPVGQVIQIVIELKGNDEPIRLDGRVIWIRKHETGNNFDIGVEFLHKTSDTIISLIRHFYGKHARIASSPH